jgi:hypothetical protein
LLLLFYYLCNLLARVHKVRPLCSWGSAFGLKLLTLCQHNKVLLTCLRVPSLFEFPVTTPERTPEAKHWKPSWTSIYLLLPLDVPFLCNCCSTLTCSPLSLKISYNWHDPWVTPSPTPWNKGRWNGFWEQGVFLIDRAERNASQYVKTSGVLQVPDR